MNFLVPLLAGTSGKPSTMRMATLSIVVAVLGTWSYVSVVKQELQILPESVVVVVVAALGSKLAQRSVEQKEKPQG